MDTFTNKAVQNVVITDTPEFITLTGRGKRIIISSTVGAYIAFEVETVTLLTGFYIGAGVPFIIDVANIAKIAYVRQTSNGRITFIELS